MLHVRMTRSRASITPFDVLKNRKRVPYREASTGAHNRCRIPAGAAASGAWEARLIGVSRRNRHTEARISRRLPALNVIT